jgi:branched-chain amino acid transport system ATP-binding protein
MTGLEFSHVSVKRNGRSVVSDFTLTVGDGEIVTLLGANGAGKSSLVLAAAGVLPTSAGVVRIDGKDLSGLPPHKIRRAGLAAVPEGHRVFSGLTVHESLRVAGSRLSRHELPDGVEAVLALFPEIAERLEQRAVSLSGGQQQMLAIANALVARPKFLLIDELSLGLAPVVVRRLVPAIREVADQGVGILLVEQFAAVALEIASRAAVIDRGRLAFVGQTEELIKQPELLHGAYLAEASAPQSTRTGRTNAADSNTRNVKADKASPSHAP